MPELPEVETVRRSLLDEIKDYHVKATHVYRADYFKKSKLGIDELENTTVQNIRRHGKQMAIVFSNLQTLIVHLGMSGRVYFADTKKEASPKHLHLRLTLSSNKSLNSNTTRQLLFVDPRRFGYLWHIKSEELTVNWQNMGKDALEIERTAFSLAISKRSTAIKSVLLNQSIVAGIGNIYADEILFDSAIHPCQPAHTLSTEQVEKLCQSTKRILSEAIKAGGSTLKDHISAVGKSGEYQDSHKVYGRAGLGCIRCGQKLVSKTLLARKTVFCPQCTPGYD